MATDVPNPNFQRITEQATPRERARFARDVLEWAIQIKRSVEEIDGGTP